MSRFDLFAYAVVALTWGGSWHVITYQFGAVPIETSLGYRFLLGALFLLPLLLANRGKHSALSRRDHLWMALQGALVFGLSYWIFYLAVGAMTSGLVAVVFCLLTIFNACNQSLFFKYPFERKVLLAIGMGLVGMGLIFAPDLRALEGNFTNLSLLLGIGWALLATWLASLGNMISLRNSRAGIPPSVFTTYSMGYGGALMLAVGLLHDGAFAFEMTAGYVLSLLYLSVLASSLAFVLYFGLIARIGAARGAYVTVLIPLVALLVSSLFEDFRWGAETIGGVVLILCGNILILSKRRKRVL